MESTRRDPDDLAAPRRLHGERGASVAEFALVCPFLFMILFGIIEFGWAFGQHLDVRHGAREGARLIAVNYDDAETSGAQGADLIGAICDRMSLASGQTVTVETVVKSDLGRRRGSFAEVTVSAPLQQLTGAFSEFLRGVTLTSQVQARIEVDATWTHGASGYSESGTCS
jgi:Flp pilus assembly protein TadG